MIANILFWAILAVLLAVGLGRLAGWCINKDWEAKSKKGFWSFVRGCIIWPVAWAAVISCALLTLDKRQPRLFFGK